MSADILPSLPVRGGAAAFLRDYLPQLLQALVPGLTQPLTPLTLAVELGDAAWTLQLFQGRLSLADGAQGGTTARLRCDAEAYRFALRAIWPRLLVHLERQRPVLLPALEKQLAALAQAAPPPGELALTVIDDAGDPILTELYLGGGGRRVTAQLEERHLDLLLRDPMSAGPSLFAAGHIELGGDLAYLLRLSQVLLPSL